MKIVADLHTHTISSGHAYSTLMENIVYAKEMNLLYLGISDHAPASEGAPKEIYFRNLTAVRTNWGDMQVLRGTELNILNEYGDIDLSEEALCQLDYAVASLHYTVFPKNRMSRCTDAAIAVMSNPSVFILGHPDDDLMPLDYEALTLAAKHYHVALEVNNSSLCPGSFRRGAADNYHTMLTLAKKLEVPIIISSDSHICYDIGNFKRALVLLEEMRFPEELVVNSSLKRFTDFWEYRRRVALSESKRSLRLAV